MSINALTNAAMARRFDFEPANTVPIIIKDIGDAAASISKLSEAGGEVDDAGWALKRRRLS
jgi:hypothetical protein